MLKTVLFNFYQLSSIKNMIEISSKRIKQNNIISRMRNQVCAQCCVAENEWLLVFFFAWVNNIFKVSLLKWWELGEWNVSWIQCRHNRENSSAGCSIFKMKVFSDHIVLCMSSMLKSILCRTPPCYSLLSFQCNSNTRPNSKSIGNHFDKVLIIQSNLFSHTLRTPSK